MAGVHSQRMQKDPSDRIIKIQKSGSSGSGKDTSNPFMASLCQKRRTRKHVITPPNSDPNGDRLVPDIERNRPNTSPRNINNNITRSNSSGEEDYREHSYYQDAQNSNADDDSGMSFDSEALHNLDT
ncbi:hypothetical protein H5410_053040 [Solanum commersonii]|uniref:Uncharacterized protein n=1 Tax=Solanum commersonii TaxID=4109 RepID=A0A9J5X4T8_SOLCO|nr:hypothetical protein H5410_053040 [Solanum commersonii]